ncbi:6531_t:CDS:2, partial [Entrophospora sp. SA101]
MNNLLFQKLDKSILKNFKSGGKFELRKSGDRGHDNHGWLDTYHTFSFASYFDPKYQSFGSLRVINEDIVKPNTGFGAHPHREFEIFSYIISGELQHKDSMGNVEILKRGDIQFTTAGTGITHSEYNIHPSKSVHFLQIWVKPNQSHLKPAYYTKSFPDTVKLNNLTHTISPFNDKVHNGDVDENSKNTIGIHSDFHMFASLLEPNKKVAHIIQKNDIYNFTSNGDVDKNNNDSSSDIRKVYVHLTSTGGELKVNDDEDQLTLKPGDGVFITDVKAGDKIKFENEKEEDNDENDDEEKVGERTTVLRLPKRNDYEIGYYVSSDYKNLGIATSAVDFITNEIIFKEFNCEKIYGIIFKDNIGSEKVLRKSGFEFVGEIEG